MIIDTLMMMLPIRFLITKKVKVVRTRMTTSIKAKLLKIGQTNINTCRVSELNKYIKCIKFETNCN